MPNNAERQIDSMGAKEIRDGYGCSPFGLLDYLESICQPPHRWEDDLKHKNIFCWLWGGEGPNPKNHASYVKEYRPDKENSYRNISNIKWRNAEPVLPEELIQEKE